MSFVRGTVFYFAGLLRVYMQLDDTPLLVILQLLGTLTDPLKQRYTQLPRFSGICALPSQNDMYAVVDVEVAW